MQLWGNKYPHFTRKETEVQRNDTSIFPVRKLRLRGVKANVPVNARL